MGGCSHKPIKAVEHQRLGQIDDYEVDEYDERNDGV
jgi:hypothetical protein